MATVTAFDSAPGKDPGRFDLMSNGARVAVHVSGSGGDPLLLIHSINAAASSAEVEPLRLRYSMRRQTYCMDLPGFGESERSDRRYTPQLMTDAITAAAMEIAARTGRPPDALAVSLSTEFLARAAVENSGAFRSLALVSPTGFSGTRVLRGPRGSTRGKRWLYKTLRGPGWGGGLFRQLTRPAVIRYFLRRTWGSQNIDQDLWQTDIRMARYPGAEFAPLYFLSGELFSADIHTIYDSLQMPVWMSHGVRGDFVDYRQLPDFARRHSWKVSVYDSGALPYFEQLEPFARDLDQFLGGKI